MAALTIGGAILVVYAQQVETAREGARNFLRAAYQRGESELQRLFGPPLQSLILARDWVAQDVIQYEDARALALTLGGLVRDQPEVATIGIARANSAWSVRAVEEGIQLDFLTATATGTSLRSQIWGRDGSLVNETSAASPEAYAPPDWFEAALQQSRARADGNVSGIPDWRPMPVTRPARAGGLVLPLVLALNHDSVETGIAVEIRVSAISDLFVGLFPSVGGEAAVFTERGELLGQTGWRVPEAAEATPTFARDAGFALRQAHDWWSTEPSSTEDMFEVSYENAAWWCLVRPVNSIEAIPLIMAFTIPQADLVFAAVRLRNDLLIVGMWAFVAALPAAWLLGRRIRRPIEIMLDHLRRHDAPDASSGYWPRTRLTEIRTLTETIDRLFRELPVSVVPTPLAHPQPAHPQHAVPEAAETPADTAVPDAQLQALFSARRSLRETQRGMKTLTEQARALERERAAQAERAGEIRNRIRALAHSDAFREHRLDQFAPELTEAAAACLNTQRAGIWRLDEDGVLTCLDRFDAAANQHGTGPMLSRPEYPEWFDAMSSDPAYGVADIRAERWTHRLAITLGGTPNATAFVACPILASGETAAVLVLEQTDGPRPWSSDDENAAILLGQLAAPMFERPAVLAAASPLEDAVQVFSARIGFLILDSAGKPVAERGETRAATTFLDTPEFRMAWPRLSGGETGITVEHAVPDDRAVWRFALEALRDAQGGFNGAAVFCQDITEDTHARATAQETAGLYRELLNAAPVLLWTTDTIGCITYANRAVERLYGYAPDDVVGKSIAILAGEEQAERDRDRLTRLLAGEPCAGSYVATHRTRAGEPISVRIQARVVNREDGRVAGAAGTAALVDEDVRLNDVGQVLGFLRDRTEMLLLGVDRAGAILWMTASPALEDRCEMDLRDFTGETLHHFLKTLRAETEHEHFLEALSTRRVCRSMFAAQFPGGCYEQAATYIPLLLDGDATLILVFLRDTTLGTSES